MGKPITVTLALMSTLLLSACGTSNSAKKQVDHHFDSQKTAAEYKHDREAEGINLANFNRINIGDITDASYGSSEDQVLKLFGTPSHVGTVTVNGVTKKTTQYTWKDVSATFPVAKVKVQFLNHKAVGKSYTPAAKRKQRITAKSKINQLGLGTTYQAAINALGTPNGQSIIGQGPMSAKYLLYVTDKNGTAYDLTFTDDKLNNKFKTSIY
ncbi:DUF3862 domain-containing protein [Lentilactobacillus buchneri]|uniref:DUF3862 domain-containing protein n=1 Tax=Lentilactobacillus buchneri TaxID=1581 RepID=UPI00287511B8|nr:DUF3862 domain-containing protein [Lentilactobacillus buchneri]MDS1015844.1 DUF3862 domain-containing protein [Lentilactobacillus buchneri]